MVTEAIRSRMVWVITGVLALLVLLALPAKAESADYETTLDRLGRLQALAEQYIEEKNSGDDPIDLTLSFTRVGECMISVIQEELEQIILISITSSLMHMNMPLK